MKTSINKAIQNSINNLDRARIATIDAHYSIIDKLEAKVESLYDSVAHVAKRQGFDVLTGQEYVSVTEVDVDTINDLLSRL